MNLAPLERYRHDVKEHGFKFDPVQERAAERLQSLYERLVLSQASRPNFFARLFKTKSEPVKGLYMWGGVGRGKTYLLDVFYESLPTTKKVRTHFHRFMRRVHAELTELKGEKNPLDKVADRLAGEAQVLCFDEFFVTDITDAMILANLLKALFERGVVLVTTSNIEPQGLYKDGLQRERFLPAIDLLYDRTEVFQVDGGEDYRLRALTRSHTYRFPCDEGSERALEDFFQALCPDANNVRSETYIEVESRQIRTKKESDDVVWFRFADVCEGPRSQHDYIVIAKEFHTVLVSGVPQFRGNNDDAARRFIYLVDEFYDRRVKLILSCAADLPSLYTGGKLSFEFERTRSRLLEMQSKEYLALPHRP